MNIQLHPNAVYYFMLRQRHLGLLIIVGIFVCILSLSAGSTMHGTVNGHPAEWVMPRYFGWVLWIFYIAIIGAVIFYCRALAKSYKIELRDNGIALHYGVINLNNEVLLFTKIQDIVIYRSFLERLMGLSTLFIQNAMGQPEYIPGLDLNVAEKLREDILSRISR